MSRNDDAVQRMDRDAIKRLEVWLARQSGGRAQVRDLQQLSGGAIQENWHLALDLDGGEWPGTHDLVLRKDAPSNVAVSHGRAEEFTILKHAHKAGVTVPVPCVFCDDLDVLGAPFFLMHRVTGQAAGHKLARGSANPELVEALGCNLARIHAIEDSPDLSFLARPEIAPALSSIKKYRSHLDALPAAHPALEWGLVWLETNAPESERITFCHRDYRTGNYMVEDGELTAILDWEFAGWSDPLEDIGWLMAKCWRFGALDREIGGVGDLDDFLRGYERESSQVVDRSLLGYWQVMAHMRWAVIALQQADRFVTGGERNLELALTAHIVPELEYEILQRTAPSDVELSATKEGSSSFPAPSLNDLLDIARDVLRSDIVNALDGDTKYKALMAANAMAIVGRQVQLCDQTTGQISDQTTVSRRIRNGEGTNEDFLEVFAGVCGNLKLSNPRVLLG